MADGRHYVTDGRHYVRPLAILSSADSVKAGKMCLSTDVFTTDKAVILRTVNYLTT